MTNSVRKLRVPIEYVNGRIRTVEQDSERHVEQCVDGILNTRLGSRIEKPEFGIPDTRFGRGVGTAQAVAAAIERWEPRADVSVTDVPALLAKRTDAFVVSREESS